MAQHTKISLRTKEERIPLALSEHVRLHRKQALFVAHPLMRTLSYEGGRMRISRRHGVDACVALADIIKRIESFTA